MTDLSNPIQFLCLQAVLAMALANTHLLTYILMKNNADLADTLEYRKASNKHPSQSSLVQSNAVTLPNLKRTSHHPSNPHQCPSTPPP